MLRNPSGIAILALLWTAGCTSPTTSPSETLTSEGDSSRAPAGITTAQEHEALVRFMNANPYARELDLWADDQRYFPSVAYKSVTPYTALKVKKYQLRLREVSADKNAAARYQELLPGQHYTVVALASKDGTPIIRAILDDLKPLTTGKAAVRLINAAPGAEDLAAYLGGNRYEMKTEIQDDIDPTAVSKFVDVNPGVMEIRPENGPAPSELVNLSIEPNRFYTLVVVGRSGALDAVRIEDRLDASRPD